MANGDLERQLEESRKKLAALNKEVDKKAFPTSKRQLKQLKSLRREYAKQAKEVDDLTKQVKALRSEKTHLTKVAEQLTSKFGGSAASVTRFTGELKNAVFTVDEGSQKMKAFGMQTGMTASKFGAYSAGITLAIAATIKFLDWTDKVEKQQGQLQRALGKTAVSMGAAQRISAKGWGIAGGAGKEAAEQLTGTLAQARKGIWKDLVGTGGEKAGVETLITMTAGMSKMVPQWVKALSETFAETSGQEIIDTIMKIGIVSKAADVPVDQFGNMIFDLAKEFVALGVDVADTTEAVGMFIDEMGKGAITPAVGMAVTRNIMQQQLTAGGLQGRFMTAAFAGSEFENLGEGTQKLLNTRTQEKYGSTYKSTNMMQRAELLGSLDIADYARVMKGIYGFLKTQGEVKAMAVAPSIAGGLEWSTLKEFFENLGEGEDIGEKFAKKLQEGHKMPEDTFRTAVDDFGKYIKENAALQQEFYAGLMEELGLVEATAAEVWSAAKGRGEGNIGAASEVLNAVDLAGQVEDERELKKLTKKKAEEGLTDVEDMRSQMLQAGKTKQSNVESWIRGIRGWFTSPAEGTIDESKLSKISNDVDDTTGEVTLTTKSGHVLTITFEEAPENQKPNASGDVLNNVGH